MGKKLCFESKLLYPRVSRYVFNNSRLMFSCVLVTTISNVSNVLLTLSLTYHIIIVMVTVSMKHSFKKRYISYSELPGYEIIYFGP